MKALRRLFSPGLALGLALLAGCDPGGPSKEKLNLILISLDTCRADRLSCYGAKRETSPNLDAFAAEAVQFEDCLAQSALTAPSHMSLLTGHYVHRHGLRNNQGSVTPPYSLASHLSALGWETAAFTGHGSFQEKHGLGYGFDTFQSVIDENNPFTRHLEHVVPEALDWLDDKQEAPFFLLVHAYDPHCPFWPDEPFRTEYGGWYRGRFKDELQGLCHPRRFGEKMSSGEIGTQEVKYINDMYDAGVAASDVWIGSFLDQIEKRGLLDDSIIVFTSDHGEVLGNHGWVGHGQVWEEALRVPLLVRFPDGQWSRTIDQPVQHVDIVPTILAGLNAPELPGLHGIDLMPLIRSEIPELSEDRMRLAHVGKENLMALRFGTRWKATFHEGKSKITNAGLYDLRKDPLEQTNLCKEEKGKERFDKIARRYLRWRKKTKDEDERFAGREGAGLTSDDDMEMLKALGYVDDSGGGGQGSTAPDSDEFDEVDGGGEDGEFESSAGS